ncbi:MAG TPA: TraB/GumN family protein [Steroidobacteraceae bacterium]|nr:TraB/GumN family protein [Steroidobacteraceae bacterium]
MAGPLRGALAALGLLGGLSAHAQSPVWAVHGAHNTVYLAESVHLLKAGHADLPTPFDAAYARARIIVMEIDLSRTDAGQIQAWMLDHGMLRGTTLQQAVGERVYARTSTEAQRLGVPIERLQPFEPWAVALMLADLEYVKLGYDPEQGVERQIEHRAERDMKEIRGLETVGEELGQLAQLTPAQQSRFLDLTVDDMQAAERDTDELLSAWRAGNTRKLASLLASEYASFPELYRALITERNLRWLPQIEGFLHDTRDYLVVVGALHLVGRGGLLELARHAGFTVTPVLSTQLGKPLLSR